MRGTPQPPRRPRPIKATCFAVACAYSIWLVVARSFDVARERLSPVFAVMADEETAIRTEQ